MTRAAPSESRLRRAARDPVLRFLLLGAAIFAAHEALRSRRDVGDPIVVSSRFVDGLRREHRQRFGRDPSPGELDRAIADFVRDEALVREATELGLDRGDSVVRRRLAQKMEMMLRGSLTLPRPTEAELRAYVEAHPESFARDARFSFRHAFFARDRRGDALRADADAARATLPTSGDVAVLGAALDPLGDPFPLGRDVTRSRGADVERAFGATFREGLGRCVAGEICGPLESAYGLHLVLLSEREASGTLPFAEARALAERAWLRDREDAALGRAIEALVARYPVERVDDATPR